MSTDILLVEKKDRVATLTFNRPEKRNSLSQDLLIKIHQTLDNFAREDEIRAVVVRGVGDKAFSSGYDIAAIPTEVSPQTREKLRDQNPLELALNSIVNFPYPVIALLNGYAFGAGCELAVCCDLRIGADDIRMGMPPAKLGLVYQLSGLMRFIQVVGISNTREIFLTGRYYPAPRAKEMGLVDYLLPRQEVEAFAYEMAREIAGNAPLSVKGTKRILNLLSKTITLSDEDRREANRIIAQAFSSEDLKEAQKAFLEKRKPEFKRR
ncbi:MAG: enoyl-CoA hydratase/isomerase family protein [Deltaproteobacteria bacterium]|nr:enoyl-CoA hydratase/isomerase family protein [Deltaproteobacteria bacterium]